MHRLICAKAVCACSNGAAHMYVEVVLHNQTLAIKLTLARKRQSSTHVQTIKAEVTIGSLLRHWLSLFNTVFALSIRKDRLELTV